jgi:hypothetical protein
MKSFILLFVLFTTLFALALPYLSALIDTLRGLGLMLISGIKNLITTGRAIGDPEELLGDPSFSDLIHETIGDIEGDLGEEGDVVDVVGDILEQGSLASKRNRANRVGKKLAGLKNPSGLRARHLLKKQNRLNKAIVKAEGRMTPQDSIPFVAVRGLNLITVDAFPNNSTFPAAYLKPLLDRSALETPSVMLTYTSSTPATPFGTSFGANTYYIYPCFIIKLGVSALNGISNQQVVITATVPVLNGTTQTITITAQMQQGFDGTITIFPYQTVQGYPAPVFGKVGGNALTTDEITITVSGLPSSATASLNIPLSADKTFKNLVRVSQIA